MTIDLGPLYEETGSEAAVRWDDLRFPAQGINPPGAGSDPDVDSATGLLLFGAAGTQTIAGVAQMPPAWLEESTIIPHCHWQKTTSAAGDVLWQFDYEIANNGDTGPLTYANTLTASSPVAGTPDNDTAGECLISSFGNVTMRDKKISCLIFWKLSRVGGDAADTYGADCRLVEFDIHYIRDGFGSQAQFTKQDWGK